MTTWLKGYCQEKGSLNESKNYFKKLPDDKTIIIEGPGLSGTGRYGEHVEAEEVPCNTFPDYWTPELWEAIDIGMQCEKRGLPFAIGWADHPAYLIDILDVYEPVIAKWRKDKAGR